LLLQRGDLGVPCGNGIRVRFVLDCLKTSSFGLSQRGLDQVPLHVDVRSVEGGQPYLEIADYAGSLFILRSAATAAATASSMTS
jgi:hypothetical protein